MTAEETELYALVKEGEQYLLTDVKAKLAVISIFFFSGRICGKNNTS